MPVLVVDCDVGEYTENADTSDSPPVSAVPQYWRDSVEYSAVDGRFGVVQSPDRANYWLRPSRANLCGVYCPCALVAGFELLTRGLK